MAARAGDDTPAPAGENANRRLFADLLFATALPGEADSIDTAAADRIVAQVATLAARRSPGTPAISLDPIESQGGRRRLGLAIVNDDMPFLVDSVSAAVTSAGLAIDRLLHPIVTVRRDDKGRLLSIAAADANAPATGEARESLIYIELERVSAKARLALVETLHGVLADVRVAVNDWADMLAALKAATRALADNPPPVAPHAAAETRGRTGRAAGIAAHDHRGDARRPRLREPAAG